MTTIKTKDNEIEIKPSNENTIDNNLEFSKYLSEVQSRIKEHITTDFVLAKLSEKDKEAIREIMSNAYYSQRVLKTAMLKANEQTWEYEEKRAIWKTKEMTEKEREAMGGLIKDLMDTFTIRLQTTAITNRNVKNNWILKLLTNNAGNEEDEEEREAKQNEKIKEGIKNVLTAEKE